ncbi:hypothetical protein AB0O91_39340 [Kitasatospora sp. NPDC089797]|uniref:hypothetical protein n=1 Tax=Kitasatospora sp. NPDC089797 TaxID=3155298 RepID=UPI00342FB943
MPGTDGADAADGIPGVGAVGSWGGGPETTGRRWSDGAVGDAANADRPGPAPANGAPATGPAASADEGAADGWGRTPATTGRRWTDGAAADEDADADADRRGSGRTDGTPAAD